MVDGKHLKSINQWYNKQIATIKEGKPQGFWSKKLSSITEKRTPLSPPNGGILGGAVNKAARLIIKYCQEQKIGTIILGWNKGQKDSINIGSKNNQKFVQIPTARLKERIKQLCQLHQLKFVETEESYYLAS